MRLRSRESGLLAQVAYRAPYHLSCKPGEVIRGLSTNNVNSDWTGAISTMSLFPGPGSFHQHGHEGQPNTLSAKQFWSTKGMAILEDVTGQQAAAPLRDKQNINITTSKPIAV
ncbi:predicted protein [Histoplasma capsulatum var. duboisii H88]|uniref:Predicted protein n=2 Tax=Ajellomyces capsulatus TaxID=5037 RepID=F0UHQ7_AJEC8|nr:predicted protein [Histoplasma capsulatum H143]EGC46266.1 predicted protein [Histoplasma capsulatum var. duboisii H88]